MCAARYRGRMTGVREVFLDRWRRSMAEGDTQFTPEGIDATVRVLEKFEQSSKMAAGVKARLEDILHIAVMELDRLGGQNGIHGVFLETDEREELVPYLLRVVEDEGLDVRDDPTESYRPW